LLDDDDLRQLVEKYANGQIKYAVVNPGLASRFIVGERLPDWKVRSSIDDSPLSLRTITAGHDVALVIVSAECSTCQLPDVGGSIARLTAAVRPAGRNVLIVMNDAIPLTTLRARVQDRSLPAATYVTSRHELLGDDLQTRPVAESPLVVFAFANGIISAVTPLR
jgi:hypothetical protein